MEESLEKDSLSKMKVSHPFSSEETFNSGVFSVKPVFFDLELNNLEKLK